MFVSARLFCAHGDNSTYNQLRFFSSKPPMLSDVQTVQPLLVPAGIKSSGHKKDRGLRFKQVCRPGTRTKYTLLHFFLPYPKGRLLNLWEQRIETVGLKHEPPSYELRHSKTILSTILSRAGALGKGGTARFRGSLLDVAQRQQPSPDLVVDSRRWARATTVGGTHRYSEARHLDPRIGRAVRGGPRAHQL